MIYPNMSHRYNRKYADNHAQEKLEGVRVRHGGTSTKPRIGKAEGRVTRCPMFPCAECLALSAVRTTGHAIDHMSFELRAVAR